MNYAILSLLFLGSAISAASAPNTPRGKADDSNSPKKKSPIATRLIGAIIRKNRTTSADNSPLPSPRAGQSDEQSDAVVITMTHLRQAAGDSVPKHPATDEGAVPEHDARRSIEAAIKQIEKMFLESVKTEKDTPAEIDAKNIIAIKAKNLVRTNLSEVTRLIDLTETTIQDFGTSSTADTEIIDASVATNSGPRLADFEQLLGILLHHKSTLEKFLPQAPVQEKPAQVVHKPTIEE